MDPDDRVDVLPALYERRAQVLAENGYLRASQEPRGERPRIVYSLTANGRRELRQWLVGRGDLKLETRDEGLLKLFFAGFAG